MSFAKAGNLGFPRMGGQRELKFALESYWAGKSEESSLLDTARDLRAVHWRLQPDAGIGRHLEITPSGRKDFNV